MPNERKSCVCTPGYCGGFDAAYGTVTCKIAEYDALVKEREAVLKDRAELLEALTLIVRQPLSQDEYLRVAALVERMRPTKEGEPNG